MHHSHSAQLKIIIIHFFYHGSKYYTVNHIYVIENRVVLTSNLPSIMDIRLPMNKQLYRPHNIFSLSKFIRTVYNMAHYVAAPISYQPIYFKSRDFQKY